jgi:hypothetical protein
MSYFSSEVIVHQVFEINTLEVISPRMEHLEARVVNLLIAESLNILCNKFAFSFINRTRVIEIILINLFPGIADKLTNSFDALSRLVVL